MFFSYIQKESGVSLTLVFSLGPEKPVYKTNRADTHACLRGHLPLLSFCYTRFEFLRFKENKNQLGKRLLSICPVNSNLHRLELDGTKIKHFLEKAKKICLLLLHRIMPEIG
jgi:hypothetical protein